MADDLNDMKELSGRVAIVTGSARNIGRASAIELARAGAAVMVHARTSGGDCQETVDLIRSIGGHAEYRLADVTDPGAVAGLVAETADIFGGVDILVSNAAERSACRFQDLDWELFSRTVDIALGGLFHLAKAGWPELAKRGGGSIIAMGGMTSFTGLIHRAHVTAAKSAVSGLIRNLALDLAEENIRANTIMVGQIETLNADGSRKKKPHDGTINIPLGRLGQPQDIAGLVRFLSGPAAGYITGQSLHCNGGALTVP
ncbi:MAG: SDR family oxidoreductase [Rhodospirillales bacterium]